MKNLLYTTSSPSLLLLPQTSVETSHIVSHQILAAYVKEAVQPNLLNGRSCKETERIYRYEKYGKGSTLNTRLVKGGNVPRKEDLAQSSLREVDYLYSVDSSGKKEPLKRGRAERKSAATC